VDDTFLSNLPLGNQIDLGGGVKPTPDPKPGTKQYTIQAGDSLTSIAVKFKTTVAKLMALNNLVNADRIKIGQVLKLP
jgi:LysM repeat protein